MMKLRHCGHRLREILTTPVSLGRRPSSVPDGTLLFFPCRPTQMDCGLAGLVAFRRRQPPPETGIEGLATLVSRTETAGISECIATGNDLQRDCLAGETVIADLLSAARALRSDDSFIDIYRQSARQEQLSTLVDRLDRIVAVQGEALTANMGRLPAAVAAAVLERIEKLKDAAWHIRIELLENVKKVARLLPDGLEDPGPEAIRTLRHINAVLNGIDRLEVRGRDSAGISLLFMLDPPEYLRFRQTLESEGLADEFDSRCEGQVLLNRGISVRSQPDGDDGEQVTLTFVYKVAAEIGSLGDNVIFLRWQIREDVALHRLLEHNRRFETVSTHTRWASVGAITEANCHPVDNLTTAGTAARSGIIHVSLNGDIDNFMELKAAWEAAEAPGAADITTDTKIIPLLIDAHVRQGHDITEAFRLALNRFEGSHAVSMHTDLAPGKLFLAQRGSGQAIFVGLAEDHYMPTSEVYGFVEETSRYLKVDGEKVVEGCRGPTQGQIFVLDQRSGGGIEGIDATYYDGTPIELGAADVKTTAITGRDIDRQNFPHYFLKEISESPASVERTLHNRWKLDPDSGRAMVTLNEHAFPAELEAAVGSGAIQQVLFIGQGTAGVAAQACAEILNHYLDDPQVRVGAMKASELSGFRLRGEPRQATMRDTLVVAISQSGTTTDTNRTVDMVRERGAHTLAIVNRRDSDLTFKVDGVLYTSSGRDIEMSVASTKAFYSQIVAGAVLGLNLARIRGRMTAVSIASEIENLLRLPDQMRTVLALGDRIGVSAGRLSLGKTYWASVGSGPNKAAADEIRIKLSELCYKTISSDFVEDKKHIDLSSEPLIIVCAAGTRDTVIGDLVKDTAIFHAHKAATVVIADENEHRFGPHADDVFHVPAVEPHLAPILNTLVGHIWGYYAALAINDGSKFLYRFRNELQKTVDGYASEGLDVYEAVLEKSFREKVARFYRRFRDRKNQNRFPAPAGLTADLTLLFKYLAGRLPGSDFEIDFGRKGTALNMLTRLFECIGESINAMSRPVDAIKHQAKTVTVGTSRISERLEGLLFEKLVGYGLSTAQLTPRNILVLRHLQQIVDRIEGAILYRIGGLDLLGETTAESTIEVESKEGVLKPIPSRVEADTRLKGTKRIIVRQGNVYIGKGRKDNRSIIIIPVLSTSPSAPNTIENLLLLNISFRDNVPLPVKIRALGGKYEHIQNIVQENSVVWRDDYLEKVEISELFGRSAEKVGEFIVAGLGGNGKKK